MSKVSVVEFELDDGGKVFVNPASVTHINEGKSYTNLTDEGLHKDVTYITMINWQIIVVQLIDEVKLKVFGQ